MKHQTILSYLFFIVTIWVIVGCQKDKEECIERIDPNCFCTEEYNPVVGCNGKTYSNPCHAECAGVSYTKGGCN